MHQRPDDGYINATELCQRAGNLFAGYKRLTQTQAFIEELPADMGIPYRGMVGLCRYGRAGTTRRVKGRGCIPT